MSEQPSEVRFARRFVARIPGQPDVHGVQFPDSGMWSPTFRWADVTEAPRGRDIPVSGGILHLPAHLTEADREAIEAAWQADHRGRGDAHRMRILPPLRARTRLLLAMQRRIDGACGWLCGHGAPWAAAWLWRACRML